MLAVKIHQQENASFFAAVIAILLLMAFAMVTVSCPEPDEEAEETLDPPGVIPLTDSEWKDGEITASSDGEAWHSFDVTEGTTYYVWWNDSVFGATPGGNRTKTLDITVSGFYRDGKTIRTDSKHDFSNMSTAWNYPLSFTAIADTTVYLCVKPNPSGTGTYGIVYSVAGIRPDVSVASAAPTALTADKWERGEITAGSNGEAWYSFTVENGTLYRLWWEDSDSDYTVIKKTLAVSVSAWYDGIGDNIFYEQASGWSFAKTFTPDADGTVCVKVAPKTSGAAGTFGIVYSYGASTTRPGVPFGPNEPPNPIPLVDGVWKDGEITTPGGEAWYSIDVTADETHYLWWNESSDYGNGTKTLSMQVSAYNSDGTSINLYDGNIAWATPKTITVTAGMTYYLRVQAYFSVPNMTGTFGIIYATTNTRPPAPIDLPDATALTAGEWVNGEMTGTGQSRTAWFSFTVAADTTYYVWMNGEDGGTRSNGDGTKTLNARLTAYYADGTLVETNDSYYVNFVNVNWIWDEPRDFTPTSAQAGKVYIKLAPYNNLSAGTFGIAYNTLSTRPAN